MRQSKPFVIVDKRGYKKEARSLDPDEKCVSRFDEERDISRERKQELLFNTEQTGMLSQSGNPRSADVGEAGMPGQAAPG